MRNTTADTTGPAATGPAGAPIGAPPRIALYSHDTMGVGHMRRNLALAQTFAAMPGHPVILMVSGAREANLFDLPANVDLVTLPAYRKNGNDQYASRCWNLPLDEFVALRSTTIAAALEAFGPDLLVVDKVPRGVGGELDLALGRIAGRTRCVLGLRDVLDDPVTVRREWAACEADGAIRDYYDAVWVYGSPAVYDPVREYGFSPELAAKVRYTGYLSRRTSPRLAEGSDPLAALGLPPGRLALCMVGGGQDGAEVARAFAAAPRPPEVNAVVLTGPFMPAEVRMELRNLAQTSGRLRVVEFATDSGALLGRADWVVVMGGYNTVCEVLSNQKHALVVPRVRPRLEQWIRAMRFEALGLLDVLHPDELSAAAIGRWLLTPIRKRPSALEQVDFGGLERLPTLAGELREAAPRARGAAACRAAGAIPGNASSHAGKGVVRAAE